MVRNLLIVDDSAEIRALFRTVLALDHPEVTVTEAASADEALQSVVDLCPDVVIVDVVMPGTDGLQLARRLRPRCPQATLVMFSSLPYGDVVEDAEAAGADAFVEKTLGYQAALAAAGLASRRRQ